MNSHKLAKSFTQHPLLWVLLILVTLVPSLRLAMDLGIKSDFKTLLPQEKPSVQALNHLIDRVGGVATLMVGVEAEDPKAIERFINDLVAKLKTFPKDEIRFVEYNVKDIKKFYSKNKYLYLDLEDLEKIHDRLAKKIRYEKLAHNPLFIALDEDKVEFDVHDIEKKYQGKTSKYDKYKDGYFFGEDKKIAAVVIRPTGASTSTEFARQLIYKVQKVVNDLNPPSYHPSMTVRFTGKFQDTVVEYQQLIKDMLETLGLCLILVGVSIYLYFLRFRIIWLLTVAVSIGAAWAFALAKWRIGYLNSQTAFLGSIIVGNGVNYGIILLARYLEERRAKRGVEEALEIAIRTTWLGTLTAATTTSIAFAALAFSEIKGFSQFGFIGGFGMTLSWVATYLALPPMLVISEKILPLVKGDKFTPRQWEFLLDPLAALVSHSPRIVGAFGILFSLACLGLATRFLPRSLEYDFSKLKNKPRINLGLEEFKEKMDNIFEQSGSPVVMLLDREEQADEVCNAVMNMEENLPDHEKTIDSCKTLQSYLPLQQKEKLAELAKIRVLLKDNSLNFVEGKYRQEINDFRKAVNLKEINIQGLPESIKRNFQELDGSVGRFAYVYPRPDAHLSNGRRLIQFATTLSAVRLEDGSVIRMSGEPAIFSDLLQAIRHDGPMATLYSFFAVAGLVILHFRRFRPASYVVGGLVLGVLYMFGIQAIMGIKLNFFNFIALPVTFGIGVDYSVNLFQRYRFEGRGSVRRVLGTVGGAILLCSITTTIGYATLLTAQSQALASFGWLGLLGEISCLFSAIVTMPAILHAYDRRHLAVLASNKPSEVA